MKVSPVLKRGCYVLFFLLLCLSFVEVKAADLLKNGTSNYSIYIANNANGTVKKAANEFKKYFLQISGVNLPISNQFSGKNQIVIGDNAVIKRNFPQFDLSSLNEDGTYVRSKGDALFIGGGTEMGVLNAVYSFFEKYLDCRYYAHDLIVIPKKRDITVNNVNITEVPAISYRSTNYGEAMNADYIQWNKVSNLPDQHKQKRYKWGLWAHTFTVLVPPKKYLQSHPEYFGLINGARSIKQLCLSQDALVGIIADTLRVMMANDPSAKYWSVSTMDGNPDNCQCDLCNKYRANNHNQSDLTVAFVNKIAALFPDKIISTLAYQKTRPAPISVVPAKNVNIHFCAVNDDKLRPLATNGVLMNDLNGWLKFTNNIIFRDYMIYYKCDCPFPNFPVLKPNLQTLVNKKIDMVYLEAQSDLGRELEELRCYLMVKLMWDQSLDPDALTNEFLKAYYGNSAPYVKQYMDLLRQAAVNGNKPLIGSTKVKIYAKSADRGYLSPDQIANYQSILTKGINASRGDAQVQDRMQRLLQSLGNVSK